MINKEIVKKVLSYNDWEFWAERPFGAFFLSLQKDGQNREYMRKIGVDAQWPATLFQRGAFYQSQTVWNIFAAEIEKYLNSRGSIFQITHSCEHYLFFGKQEIQKICGSNLTPQIKLRKLYPIL